MYSGSQVIIRQRLISAKLNKNFPNIVDGKDSSWTSMRRLSVLDNLMLVVRGSSVDIYNTSDATRIACIEESAWSWSVRPDYSDVAWISRSCVVGVTKRDIVLVSVPSCSENVVKTLPNWEIHSVSVSMYPSVVIYVSLGTQGVMTSSDEGVTWSTISYLKPRDGWATIHAIGVAHTDTTWTIELSDQKPTFWHVRVYQSQGGTINDIFKQRFTSLSRPRLQYDGRYNVLLVEDTNSTVYVFDIAGQYQGPLNITGLPAKYSKRRSIDIDPRKALLFTGHNDGTIKAFDLFYDDTYLD